MIVAPTTFTCSFLLSSHTHVPLSSPHLFVLQGSTTRGLEVFLGIMMAGFAGNTSSMISATVVSLGRILFEYGELCFTVCPQLLETIGLLLRHRAREVVGAAVGFIKVAVVKLPPAMIDSFLPALIPALTGWSTEARRCSFLSSVLHCATSI